MPSRSEKGPIEVRPLTPERWNDLVELFGPDRGASGACWCMFWRQPKEDWKARTKTSNRRKLQKLTRDGPPPGLLAYRDDRPVGWVSIAPRKQFPRLNTSQYLKQVDKTSVWSIVCFYIRRGHRKSGVASALLAASVDAAAKRGARVIEAYPVDPVAGHVSTGDAWTGVLEMFTRAGFREVERRHPSRPIVRKRLRASTSR